MDGFCSLFSHGLFRSLTSLSWRRNAILDFRGKIGPPIWQPEIYVTSRETIYTSCFSFCRDAETYPLYWRFRQVYFCGNANCRHVSASRKFRRYSIIHWVPRTVSAEAELDRFTLCSLHVFCRFLFRWIIYSLHFLNVETLLNSPVWNHILFILSGI